jgi:hypothetical protein
LTYNLIAHEGAHQILANLGVQKRLSRWPLWFVEGLAEYFAPTETGRRIRWQGVGSINPVRRSEFFAAAGRGAAGGALVRETVSATGVDLSFYSKSWALVHYLAQKRPKEFNAYLAEVSKLEGYAPAPDGPTLFAKHFGDDFAALQTGLLRHLQSAR